MMTNKEISEFVSYCKVIAKEGAVFMTCDPKHHIVAEDLISRGWVTETTKKHVSSGGKDRTFELTPEGEKETSWIWVD